MQGHVCLCSGFSGMLPGLSPPSADFYVFNAVVLNLFFM